VSVTQPPRSPASAPGVIEAALVLAFPLLVAGLVVSPLLLLVPWSAEPLGAFIAQLATLVALGLAVSWRVAPVSDRAWFSGYVGWSLRGRTIFGAVVLIVIPTGLVGLVTLASSAALRFPPSLQYLQLLSALDIAWAAAALMIGVRWLRGDRAALAAGVTLAVACVVSVWNYLRVVGFAPDGGWLVDGTRLMQLVLPFDTVAALVAVIVLLRGLSKRTRGAAQPTEQARPQS